MIYRKGWINKKAWGCKVSPLSVFLTVASSCKKYKAIKYRAYPDERQAVMFAKTFGRCRKVYNLMLADKGVH